MGEREWGMLLPNARLITIDGATYRSWSNPRNLWLPESMCFSRELAKPVCLELPAPLRVGPE